MPPAPMHEKLLAYGWTYVNIDDGWPADTRSADGRLLPNEKFPDFKGLSDYVHSLGLKFGILLLARAHDLAEIIRELPA